MGISHQLRIQPLYWRRSTGVSSYLLACTPKPKIIKTIPVKRAPKTNPWCVQAQESADVLEGVPLMHHLPVDYSGDFGCGLSLFILPPQDVRGPQVTVNEGALEALTAIRTTVMYFHRSLPYLSSL